MQVYDLKFLVFKCIWNIWVECNYFYSYCLKDRWINDANISHNSCFKQFEILFISTILDQCLHADCPVKGISSSAAQAEYCHYLYEVLIAHFWIVDTQASNKCSFATVKQLSLIAQNLFQSARSFQQFAVKSSESNSQEWIRLYQYCFPKSKTQRRRHIALERPSLVT